MIATIDYPPAVIEPHRNEEERFIKRKVRSCVVEPASVSYDVPRLNNGLLRDIAKISSVQPLSEWIDSGECQPLSDECRARANFVMLDLYSIVAHPGRIAATRTNGIMLIYKKGGAELEIEIDNELDITGVISVARTVADYKSLTDKSDYLAFARQFRELAQESA